MRKRHSGIFSNYNNVLALLMFAAVLISSFIAVIFSGCYQNTSFVLSEDTVPSELTEVIIPQLLLDYCGVTAEDQLIAFGESIDRSERAEQVIVNSDGSLSYFCTDRQISNNIRRDASFLQEETERINSIFADYLVINDNYTEMIIRVNDFETYNSIFNILPLGCICGYIQIFSHPENPEWQLRITIINTNTDIVGCECTIPDEVFYLECQQFFEDTNDIETYNSDESAHNVIITTGDLSTVSTTPSVDISTYETWMPDDDLTSEENLNNYYEQILVPELDEIESSEQTFDVVSVWGQGIILYPQVDMYGIALTYTADINADELPEMLVFRYERRRDESRSLDFNELHMSVASINDGSIYISDDIALDDYYASGYLYRLAEDNTIRPVSSAVQIGEGSDDITGIVTEYDQYGNVISEEDRGGEWPYFFTPDSWYEERGIILTTDASESDINFENAEVIYRSIFDFNHDYDNPQFILNIRGE